MQSLGCFAWDPVWIIGMKPLRIRRVAVDADHKKSTLRAEVTMEPFVLPWIATEVVFVVDWSAAEFNDTADRIPRTVLPMTVTANHVSVLLSGDEISQLLAFKLKPSV